MPAARVPVRLVVARQGHGTLFTLPRQATRAADDGDDELARRRPPRDAAELVDAARRRQFHAAVRRAGHGTSVAYQELEVPESVVGSKNLSMNSFAILSPASLP